MVTGLFGRVPRAGERIESQGVAFEVVRTDTRTLQTVLVEQLSPAADPPHHA
jgi:Mg2+/Co2+ transporter CorC